ncbi:Sec14p-like phosphatidylinositol transfer family protein [Actinidia rufa]|uniref:Sec14p-like phosphatidylinositol transfer family protein n=1 Tax=Actinidia rufa TaxID=165716 RepID=A0A7J0GMG7_9ERIC|nr:Sec14p-like phosphatidylinositol transfer family protein [Actinidia rufa]
MALRLCPPLRHQFLPLPPPLHSNRPTRLRKLSVHSPILEPNHALKLVTDVKGKLEKDHHNLPVGKYGRDDEDMILWFLKDRKFSVEDAASKLAKVIKWRQEFGVSDLSEDLVRTVAETGKAFVHDFLDLCDRPVLIVVASKHFPGKQNHSENEKLCVFLIEKALSKLPAGKEEILGIFDLRGFGTDNADLQFLTFLVRFCSVEDVIKEYFTESTIPTIFRD